MGIPFVMSIEGIKAVALLCQIAFTGPQQTTDQIEFAQSQCHSYYAECVKNDSMEGCMMNRPAYLIKIKEAEIRIDKEINDRINKKK